MSSSHPETGLFRKLGTLSRRLRTLFDARSAEYGLTQARARILLRLAQRRSMTQAELAEAMEVERPTMARLLDAMEAGGLLRREISAEDRRYRNVVLTNAAQGEVESVLALTSRLQDEVLDGIPPEDLEVVERVICRMLDNIGKTGG